MSDKMEQLYQERLKRYVTAMRNEKPDRVPIRPFAAEFAGKYAGYTCQQVTHDMDLAFAAARKCAADFDWDATVGNMVYVWTGLVDAVGLNYYIKPGIDGPPDSGFQYVEPKDEQNAHMKADEYDLLIEDPTDFLANVWMPRVNNDVRGPGRPNTYRNNLSWLKGGMGMLSYFNKFGEQNARLRKESGTVSAISGCLKAPFDILADKLRGFVPLCMDLFSQPEKVMAACEALMPHMMFNALAGADPEKKSWMPDWLRISMLRLMAKMSDGLVYPSGMAAEGENLYVAEWFKGEILQIVADGQVLAKPKVVASGLEQPEGLAFTRDGALLAIESTIGRLVKIDPVSGKKTVLAEHLKTGLKPGFKAAPSYVFSGVSVGSDGSIYVSCDAGNEVVKVKE